MAMKVKNKNISLNYILGDWSVTRTATVFRISQSEGTQPVVIAWNKKNGEHYVVSDINIQLNQLLKTPQKMNVKHKCPKCGKTSTNRGAMTIHIRSCKTVKHEKKIKQTKNLAVIEFQTFWPANNWKTEWKCNPIIDEGKVNKMDCILVSGDNLAFKATATRMSDERTLVENLDLKCPKCGKICKNKGGLTSHIRCCKSGQDEKKVKEVDFKCQKCGSSFKNKGALGSHFKYCKIRPPPTKQGSKNKLKLEMTWPQFVHEHKEMPIKDVSSLWSEYKKGSYAPPKFEISREMKKNAFFLLGHGTSMQDVSTKLGLTNNIVKALITELRERSLLLIRGGVKRSEVTRLLGVHPKILRRWQKSSGLSGKTNSTGKSALKGMAFEMIIDGNSKKNVARRLGITQGSVTRWLNEEGLIDPEKFSEIELRKEAVIQIQEGFSIEDVSKTIGKSKYMISKWKKDAGLKIVNNTKYTIEQENDVIDLLREHTSLTKISQITGVSIYMIQKWKHDAVREGFL